MLIVCKSQSVNNYIFFFVLPLCITWWSFVVKILPQRCSKHITKALKV